MSDIGGDHVGPDMAGGRSLPMVNFSDSGQGQGPASFINPPGRVGGSDIASSVKSGLGGFLSHMFLFDSRTKCDLLNLAQYSILGVAPVILMLKMIKNYFPNANESKGTPELAIECTLEVLFILFCIYYIHRFICYIPTYSGVKYDSVNFTQSVLMFLVILFTIQTKLGTKLNILVRRATHMVEGYTSFGDSDGDGGASYSTDTTEEMNNSLERRTIISQSQPLSGQPMVQPMVQPMASLVPSSAPGLGLPTKREASNSPREDVPLGNAAPGGIESFSSGSLSGTAW